MNMWTGLVVACIMVM